MSALQLFSAVGFPALMVIGGILAWRMSRKETNTSSTEQPSWRDDSLDEWRRQRDAEVEAERTSRTGQALHERLAAEEQIEKHQHQRLGG